MKFSRTSPPRLFALFSAVCLLAFTGLAQQRGGFQQGGGGGFGGQGGGRAGAGGAGTRQYPNNSAVGDAIISADYDGRRLIVITDDETSQQISQVVTNMDRPKPQVLIKVVFLEVTYNNNLDFGIEGGVRRDVDKAKGITGVAANAFGLSGLNNAATGGITNIFGQGVQSFGQVPPGAGLYQVLGTDFQATMRAIAQAGKTEVLSRPSILTRNNQPATITVGQSVPLVSNTRFDAVNGQINTVSYQNVGIILRVTPFITQDGKVEMIVAPEISSLADRTEWVPISSGALAPVINTRSADTVVVTPDGQTVVIGGLMQNNRTQSDSKVPLLGDIPLLGMAFKRKVKTNVKTELIIFLTPHIVTVPGQLASLSARERANSEMIPKAFTEKELNTFLDTIPEKQPAPTKPAPQRARPRR